MTNHSSSHSERAKCRCACLGALGVFFACSGSTPLLAQTDFPPATMKPAPITQDGSLEEYSLFPATPVPGHPGADPAQDRPVWDQPEYISYPGSVEHYRVDTQKYIAPRNPRNSRSLVKSFPAVSFPGITAADGETFAEPVQYVMNGTAPGMIRTGDKRPPVPVVRLKPGGKRLRFQIGPLPVSLYVVRLIAAVETKDVELSPRDLILDMTINDGPHGEVNHYALRQNGTDNFYSMGEFFFHVVDGRKFDISVGLHPDSKIDLLVNSVDVHDELAETAMRAGKTRSVLVNPKKMRADWQSDFAQKMQKQQQAAVEARLKTLSAELPGKSDAELLKIWRERRDDTLWNALPPINQHFIGILGASVKSSPDPATAQQLQAQNRLPDDSNFAYGSSGYKEHPFWRLDIPVRGLDIDAPWRLVWQKEDGAKEYYTADDLKAGKPLPGLPFEVAPWGKRFPLEGDKANYLFPQAQAVNTSLYRTLQLFSSFVDNPDMGIGYYYLRGGNQEYARDLSLLLVRLAYDLPTYARTHDLGNILMRPEDYYWRLRAHQTLGRSSYQFIDWQRLAQSYDQLFPYIQNNQELADAVGKHIPWVKTPKDVVALLDTYLLQYGAKQMMYFQHFYDHEHAAMLATMAAIQNDPAITKPWMDFIFSRTWEYPLPRAGLDDYIYLSTQRDGTSNIGSFFYALQGGIGTRAAKWLDYYVQFGGDPKYKLSDPVLYPRVTFGPYFPIEGRVAGMHMPAIGDVGGPDTKYGEWLGSVGDTANVGWRWTHDPRFAYDIVHYGHRVSESDAEWAEIQKAAQGVRNPFMSNRSRILSDWEGVLEGGTQSDDFRFRHAARVRVGQGYGHAQQDSLDLGVWSLGLTMAGNGGARGGYGRPAVEGSMMHNVVTVDRQDFQGVTYVPDLADMGDVHYLRATAPFYQREFSRQDALIEVDKGRAAKTPPSDPSLEPGTKYDNDVVLPRAYVFDVFRVAGGTVHQYNFHGPTEDEFTTNIAKVPLSDEEKAWMEAPKQYIVKDQQWAGDVGQDGLIATWRMSREPLHFTEPQRGDYSPIPTEQAIMGAAYDPNSPRKYLRLHLPGQGGARFLTGVWTSSPGNSRAGNWLRNIHLQRTPAAGASSLFAAIIEPYAGEPFITSTRLEGDVNNAQSFAAVHVETKDGIHDLCFADSSDKTPRKLEDGTQLQAQFAYLSRDADGLRRADVVGGTLLQTKELTIRPARDEWRAKVLSVDYLNKTAKLDAPLPSLLGGSFFEIGAPADKGHLEHWTSFEATSVEPQGPSTLLQWRKGADIFSGKITNLERAADGTVTVETEFAPNTETGRTQLAATNAARTKIWRCDVSGNKLTLYGAPVGAEDFKAGGRIYLYEFGPGATWRIATKISLVRQSDGVYKLQANVPCDVTLASNAQWSSDGQTWKELPAGSAWHVTADMLGRSTLLLRWPGR